MEKLNILFLGNSGTPADDLLKPLGNVDYNNGNATPDFNKYDLVALSGDQYSGDFNQLLGTWQKSKASIGVINMTPDQVTAVTKLTGIAPSGTAQAVLAAVTNDGHGNDNYIMKYLLQYPQDALDIAAKAGLTETYLMNSFINAGIKAHFDVKNADSSAQKSVQMVAGPPPTNNLIPTYSESPFKMIQIPQKNLSQSVSSMYNISNITMALTSTLYIYGENASGNNDYIVIIVTQMNNISNGNPVSYTQTDMPSCGSCVFNYEWDQYFGYTLAITAQNTSGQAYSGLTIYDSSPVNASHGQTSITDSIGVPNPFSIYMQVLNGGSWQNVNFPAQYTNTINTATVKWFDISSVNNESGGVAGVNFNIPTDVTGWYQGDHSVQPVNFEVVSAYRFPASLVQNGALPVVFNYNISMNMTQKYTTLVSCGSPGWPQTTTTNGGGTQNFLTDTYDLVALTQTSADAK